MNSYARSFFTSRIWRLLLVSILACQSLWSVTQPAAASSFRQEVEATLDTPFELGMAQDVIITDSEDALYIWFGNILRDNRCRIGETCEKEGHAEFQLFASHHNQQDNEMLAIGTDADQRIVRYRDYEIELVSVDPEALKPEDNYVLIDYRLTLLVRVAASQPEETGEEQQSNREEVAELPTPTGLEPRIADRCRNFSAYDAAAILQEPVNADAPIGNIVVGPLIEEGFAAQLRGFCGYTNLQPISDPVIDDGQTHIATQLEYSHVVFANHLTADLLNSASTGNMITDWFDLSQLAAALSAGSEVSPEETFEFLYSAINSGDSAVLIDVLQKIAKSNPSFKATKIPGSKAGRYEEMLWLWQTLEDGYFSLLISRTGTSFDLVGARLGADANEKYVRAYSQVIIQKIAEAESTDQCEQLDLDTVREIVGERVEAHPVANEQGEGCKYTPVGDNVVIDRADFTHFFPYAGLLAGQLYPNSAKQRILSFAQELSTTGVVRDGQAMGDLLDEITEGTLESALRMMGEIEWNSYQWQVELLEDDSLLISDIPRTGLAPFFMFKVRSDGGVNYLAGTQDQEIDEIREALIAAMAKLSAAVAATSEAAPTDQESNATDDQDPVATGTDTPADQVSTATGNCTLLTLDDVAAILGEPVRGSEVTNKDGSGCKYTPAKDKATVDPSDYSTQFESHGVLVGLMSNKSAQMLLGNLHKMTAESDSALNADVVASFGQAVEEGDIQRALQILATFQAPAGEWSVTALSEVGDDAVWLRNSMLGYTINFFFRSQSDGGIWSIAVQLPKDRSVEGMSKAASEMLKKLPE